MQKAHYSPPWANTSIIGIAGGSGSGKTTLSHAIVQALNLPWVVILSMDSFYKVLSKEESEAAFRSEFDFDAPDAIDFDLLVAKLRDLRAGKKTDIPVYSFEKHARLDKSHTIYSPHVLVLEGIFALHDKRVLEMMDLKIFADADSDLCLSRRLVRDIRERGRDIEGCIKQWFLFVKPNFLRYVSRQRDIADIIIPRGVENQVAIDMVIDHVRKTLKTKSKAHQAELKQLGKNAEDLPIPRNVVILERRPQLVGIMTIINNPETAREDLIFNFDRIANVLIEKAAETATFMPKSVITPYGNKYNGCVPDGIMSAVSVLRGGSVMEPALKRVLPDCITGRMLIQTNYRTGEPELHSSYMAPDISEHSRVLLLDPQMSSGGAALMAVRVLLDHGVREDRIVFVTYFAGKQGLARLLAVFPSLTVIVARVGQDQEERWLEQKYLGC